jgi:hypothetical protein
VRAVVLGEVPNTNTARFVTRNNFALVGVDNNIIDWVSVAVGTLNSATAGFPDLHTAILRACDHPLSLAVECNARDIVRVTFKGEESIGVGRLDIVEFDIVAARSSQESLVGRDAEAIDLRVGVLNGTGANTRESFPETTARMSVHFTPR